MRILLFPKKKYKVSKKEPHGSLIDLFKETTFVRLFTKPQNQLLSRYSFFIQ